MDLKVPEGKYVLAVSGGVASMVLLDLLSQSPGVELIAAHFNHGIRPDAAKDEALVAEAAGKYGLRLEIGHAKLGKGASEDAARQARYGFLRRVQQKHGASNIITAHHQDDMIETALINLMRGSGRLGLTAIASNPQVLRPLLDVPKSEILKYAANNAIDWREDSTNQSDDNLRSRLRHHLLPKLTPGDRRRLIAEIKTIAALNSEIDKKIANLSLLVGNGAIDREAFTALPTKIGSEVLMHRLRESGIRDFDAKTINRLNVAIRTAKADSLHDIRRDARLKVSRRTAELISD